VSKLAEGTSSAIEPEFPAPAEAKGESAQVLKPMVIMVQGETKMAKVPKQPDETEKSTEEPEPKRSANQPKILTPSQETGLPKMTKFPATTPKRRRMASVLDAVMDSTRVPTPATTEVPSMSEKNTKETAEADTTRVEAKVGPLVSTETEHFETVGKDTEQGPSDVALILEKEDAPKKVKSPTPEAPTEELDFVIQHASGKQLSEEQIAEAKHYARDLKYPKGSLVFNGTNEDDFMYCLPDNKEISVCREMARNIGFLKLELGLSAMSKDDLADSLVYNSLKVKMF
jgi:hypothetical protein